MRLLLCADWTDWEQSGFERAISGLGVSVDVKRQHWIPRRRAARYLSSALEALRTLLAMPGHDAAVAWQQVVGVALAAVAPGFLLRRCPVTVAGFIGTQAGPLPIRVLRDMATRRALRRAAAVVCYSTHEAARLRALFPSAADKIHSLALGFDIPRPRGPNSPVCPSYAMSAGMSNRDYATLFSAASKFEGELLVYAPKTALNGRDDYPSNVTIASDFTWKRFFEDMAMARVVLVTIDDPDKTAGQLVAVQAMHLGRPIVATRCAGLDDYLHDGHTAILVPPHDANALADAVHSLYTDDLLSRRLGAAAARDAQLRLTASVFWERMLEIASGTRR